MLRRLLIALVFPAALAFADDEQTLLKSGEIRSGGFGGPLVKFSPINGEPGTLVGGRGGWLINSAFSIGGGGYGLANRVRADHPDSVRLDMGVGGLVLEAVVWPNRLVHVTASVLIGGGGLNFRTMHGRADEDKAENFFALEPEVALEINIIRHFRICPGVSYRYLAGDTDLVDSYWDLSGPAASLTFKFGKF